MQKVRVVFAGECGVGKTALARKLLGGGFEEGYYPSIELEMDSFKLKIDEENEVLVEYTEIPGDPSINEEMFNESYLNADILILLYDSKDPETFKALTRRLNHILGLTKEKLLSIVSNKNDGESQALITSSEGEELAKEYGALFFEISVQNDVGLVDLFVSTTSSFLEGTRLNLAVLTDAEKVSALYDAVLDENLENIKALATHVDICSMEGEPLIISAARAGKTSAVELLLEMGVDANMKTKERATALHFASWKGNLEVIKRLVAAGADINGERDDGWTSLHFAAKGGHVSAVEFLLEAGCSSNPTSRVGSTPMLISVSEGRIDIVRRLLQHGVDVNHPGDRNQTAIFFAVRSGNSELVELLLENGADVNREDVFGMTPLHLAVESKKSAESASLLVQRGGDVLKSDSHGRSAIVHSIVKNDAEVFRIYSNGLSGLTPAMKSRLFIESVSSGSIPMIKQVCTFLECGEKFLGENSSKWEEAGNAREDNPNLAILLAAEAGRVDILKHIVGMGIMTSFTDEDENSALHFAAKSGDAECAAFLLSGTETAHVEPNARNKSGETALHIATLRVAEKSAEVLRVLLGNGADPNAKDNDGNTAVLAACTHKNSTSALKILLASRGDPNAVGFGSLSPLFVAMFTGNHNSVALLLEYGASQFKSCVINGIPETPLSYCLNTSNIACLSTLIEGGVDLSSPMRDGLLPVESTSSSEIRKLLIANGAATTVGGGDGEDGPRSLGSSFGTPPDVLELLMGNEYAEQDSDGAGDSFLSDPQWQGGSPTATDPPNHAFKSYLIVSIGDPELSPTGEATYYPINIKDLRNDTEHNVMRRFREFYKLYSTISSLASRPLPRHPPKKVFGRFKDARISRRKDGFQSILNAIVVDPNLVETRAVRKFLET